jgi:hypothetical protein
MRRPLLIAAAVVALVSGSMVACDAVPDVRAAHSLEPARAVAAVNAAAPAQAVAAADASAPLSTIVPVAGTPVLWGYVDGAGMAHFASSQIDSRYDQVLRETDGRRVPGKTQGTDGLLTWLEISPDVKALQPLLDEAAKTTGVDEELLKAVITVESSYNARAVSPRGAVGLMQLTPVTADRYGTKEERQTPAHAGRTHQRVHRRTHAGRSHTPLRRHRHRAGCLERRRGYRAPRRGPDARHRRDRGPCAHGARALLGAAATQAAPSRPRRRSGVLRAGGLRPPVVKNSKGAAIDEGRRPCDVPFPRDTPGFETRRAPGSTDNAPRGPPRRDVAAPPSEQRKPG